MGPTDRELRADEMDAPMTPTQRKHGLAQLHRMIATLGLDGDCTMRQLADAVDALQDGNELLRTRLVQTRQELGEARRAAAGNNKGE